MKITIDANTDALILAVRAAEALAKKPESQREALICFEDGYEFFVRRLKAGYSVKQIIPHQ